MASYKLIKIYPGSPELGYVSKPKFEGTIEHYWAGNWFNPQNYPEFWKEIKLKSYQILSFMYKGELSTLRDNGYYVYEKVEPKDCPDGNGATLEDMLDLQMYPGCIIYSIKRLSDGEVFTVGDKLIGTSSIKDGNTIISSFKLVKTVDGETIHINHTTGTTTYAFKHDGNCVKVNKRIPLFTTEDNVEIFEGNAVYYVGSNYDLHYVNVYVVCGLYSNVKWFFKKQKAQEFIDMNKPMYSKQNVKRMFYTRRYSIEYVNLYIENLKCQ